MEDLALTWTPRQLGGTGDAEDLERKDMLLRKCRDAIQTLKEDLESEREGRQAAEERCSVLEEKLFENSQAANSKRDEIAQLHVDAESLARTVDDLQQNLISKDQLVSDVQEEATALASTIEQLEKQVDDLTAALAAKDSELQDAQDRIYAKETELQTTRQEADQKRTDDYKSILSRVATAEQDATKVEQELTERYTGMIERMEKEHSERLEAAKAKRKQAKRDKSYLTNELEKMMREVKEVRDVNEMMATNGQEKDGIVTRLTDELERQRRLATESVARVQELEAAHATLQATARQTADQLAEALAKASILQTSESQKAGEIERLSSDLISVRSQLKSALTDYESLQATLKTKLDEQTYINDIKNVETAWSEVVSAKNSEIAALKSDNAKIHGVVKEMQESLLEINKTYAGLQDEKLRLEGQVTDLRGQLSSAQGKLATTQTQLQDTDATNAAALDEIKRNFTRLKKKAQIHERKVQELERQVSAAERKGSMWKECLRQELSYIEKWDLSIKSGEDASGRYTHEHLKNIMNRIHNVIV